MSERILTLFGEEIVPEQQKAAPRSRAKKKEEEKRPEAPALTLEKAIEQPATAIPAAAAEKKLRIAGRLEGRQKVLYDW